MKDIKQLRIDSVKKIINQTLNSIMPNEMKRDYVSSLVNIIKDYDEVDWYLATFQRNVATFQRNDYINLIDLFAWKNTKGNATETNNYFDYWDRLYYIIYEQ